MNPSHIIGTGGVTVVLARVLEYLTHWPLQPLNDADATAFAGLIVLLGGGVVAYLNRRFNLDLPTAQNPPVPPAAPGQ